MPVCLKIMYVPEQEREKMNGSLIIPTRYSGINHVQFLLLYIKIYVAAVDIIQEHFYLPDQANRILFLLFYGFWRVNKNYYVFCIVSSAGQWQFFTGLRQL